MDPKDDREKLIALFASLAEVRTPEPAAALGRTVPELSDGQQQAAALAGSLLRTRPGLVDPQAVGRRRFPNLQGTASHFAAGLEKNPDLAAEIFAAPEVFAGAVALDQAAGRLIFAGQLVWYGGETGELLAGAAAAATCTDTIDKARARLADLNAPADLRADLALCFSESFRTQQDHQQRVAEAHAQKDRAAQPYQDQIKQAHDAQALASLVDAFMSAVKSAGGTIE